MRVPARTPLLLRAILEAFGGPGLWDPDPKQGDTYHVWHASHGKNRPPEGHYAEVTGAHNWDALDKGLMRHRGSGSSMIARPTARHAFNQGQADAQDFYVHNTRTGDTTWHRAGAHASDPQLGFKGGVNRTKRATLPSMEAPPRAPVGATPGATAGNRQYGR